METPSSSLPPAGQPEQKSNTTKIILIVTAAAIGLCLIACIVGVLIFRSLGTQVAESVDMDPQAVSGSAADIAEFDLPPGFEPQTSMNLLGFTFITYEATSRDSAIILLQMPVQDDLTPENIRQMREQLERQTSRTLRDLDTVDSYDLTIRGKPAQVILQEGISENGQTFRQMLVAFSGKGGLAMIAIFGPVDTWDQNVYDQMIQSIR